MPARLTTYMRNHYTFFSSRIDLFGVLNVVMAVSNPFVKLDNNADEATYGPLHAGYAKSDI